MVLELSKEFAIAVSSRWADIIGYVGPVSLNRVRNCLL